MDLSEARMPLPARRYAPLTAQMFQDEVTRRIRTEVHHAVKTFLRAYRVANLEDLPSVNQMHGYFAMVAPGRLASSSPPIPIAAGLCATNRTVSIADASPERIASLLGKNTPLSNRVLGQLMAMNRLLVQGEPELALIGCVTAIEWFLNDRFGDLVRRSRSGREISASISACLRSGALNFIAEGMKAKLMELALTRNAIVHGPPPAREPSEVWSTRQCFVVEPKFVRDSLFLALDLYRAVNLNSGRSQDAAEHGVAPERSGELIL